MITLACVLNPSRLDSWFSSLGHSSMPSYSIICEKRKKSTYLSKYPLHFLEQSKDVNIISSHMYVHKCFLFIYTYNMWTYMHIYVYMYIVICVKH